MQVDDSKKVVLFQKSEHLLQVIPAAGYVRLAGLNVHDPVAARAAILHDIISKPLDATRKVRKIPLLFKRSVPDRDANVCDACCSKLRNAQATKQKYGELWSDFHKNKRFKKNQAGHRSVWPLFQEPLSRTRNSTASCTFTDAANNSTFIEK